MESMTISCVIQECFYKWVPVLFVLCAPSDAHTHVITQIAKECSNVSNEGREEEQ